MSYLRLGDFGQFKLKRPTVGPYPMPIALEPEQGIQAEDVLQVLAPTVAAQAQQPFVSPETMKILTYAGIGVGGLFVLGLIYKASRR